MRMSVEPSQRDFDFARQEGRVVFTHDHDFLILHAEGKVYAGIVYARQSSREELRARQLESKD